MLTTYSANKLIDHGMTSKASYSMPAAIYMGLLASDPTVAGLQTSELTFTGYARISVTAKFASAASREAVNSAEINYGIPGTADNPVAYVATFDASSGGNMIAYELLPTPRAVNANGRPLRFAAGTVTMRMT